MSQEQRLIPRGDQDNGVGDQVSKTMKGIYASYLWLKWVALAIIVLVYAGPHFVFQFCVLFISILSCSDLLERISSFYTDRPDRCEDCYLQSLAHSDKLFEWGTCTGMHPRQLLILL